MSKYCETKRYDCLDCTINKYSVCYTRLMLKLSCRSCIYEEDCKKVKEQGYHSLYDYYNITKH